MTAGKIRAGSAWIEIFADDSKLKQGLRRAGASLKAFGRSASTLGRSIATTAAIAAFPIALAVRTFKSFDDEMRFVQATSQAIGAEFDLLTAKARELGRTTSFTATQVASAMAELGRGGFKPLEIDAAIASILDLARATRTDIPTATKIAINVLRVFGMEASKMTDIVDILVTVANNSTTSLVELGESMKFASATAANLGLSAKETAKILGILATLGLGSSLSGTSFNQLMIQLTRPDALRKLEQFGIGVKQLNAETGKIDIRAPDEILLELGKFLSKLGNIKRTQILKDLFGIRGARAGGRFAGSTKVFDDMTEALDNVAGAGRRAAEVMDAGLGGVWRRLLSAVDDLKIAIGTALEPALMRMGTRFKDSIVDMSKWVGSNEDAITTALKLIASLGIMGTVIWGVGTAATALGVTLAVLGGPLGIAVGVIAVALAALTVAFVNAKIEGILLGEVILGLIEKITGWANAYTTLRDAEARASRERRVVGGDLIRREQKEPEFRGSVKQIIEQEIIQKRQQKHVADKERNLAKERLLQSRVPWYLRILDVQKKLDARLLNRKLELKTARNWLHETEIRMAEIRKEEIGKFFPEAPKPPKPPKKPFEGRNAPGEQALVEQFFGRSTSKPFDPLREVMQSHQDTLDRILIEGQEKGLARTKDLINQEYDVRIRKAKELFQNTEALEKQRNARLGQAGDAMIRRQRDLADEHAELQIRATKRGSAQEMALLKEQRRQALRDAGGIDKALIDRNFNLREQIARAGSDRRAGFATADAQGSNAAQAAWIRHNFERNDDPAQQLRRKIVELAVEADKQRATMIGKLTVPQPKEI